METLWIIPLHIIPVVSFQGLSKGKMKKPVSGMDRLNLTDVGKVVHDTMTDAGANVKFKGVRNPFPWEMVFKIDKDPKASLRGIVVENSTFRSIFKLMYFPEREVEELVRRSVSIMERDLLYSPYWKSSTWERFSSMTKLSKERTVKENEKLISSLDIRTPSPSRSP